MVYIYVQLRKLKKKKKKKITHELVSLPVDSQKQPAKVSQPKLSHEVMLRRISEVTPHKEGKASQTNIKKVWMSGLCDSTYYKKWQHAGLFYRTYSAVGVGVFPPSSFTLLPSHYELNDFRLFLQIF